MERQAIYPKGFYVNQSKVEFVKESISIKVEDFQNWLSENSHLINEKGYINIDIKLSRKDNKPYAEVNTFKPIISE